MWKRKKMIGLRRKNLLIELLKGISVSLPIFLMSYPTLTHGQLTIILSAKSLSFSLISWFVNNFWNKNVSIYWSVWFNILRNDSHIYLMAVAWSCWFLSDLINFDKTDLLQIVKWFALKNRIRLFKKVKTSRREMIFLETTILFVFLQFFAGIQQQKSSNFKKFKSNIKRQKRKQFTSHI